MGLFVKYFLLLIFLVFMYTASLLIFAKGFLLKRIVVDKNSSCAVDFSLQSDQHGKEGCWMHRRFSKAIIVIIDALRFDFMEFDPEFKQEVYYKNKLSIFRKLLMTKPGNSKLYKFIADPPTTTLQRLKGLVTGSLPTFVDVGSNFASSEITEDNIIDHLVRTNKQVKFLGDDTWMGLFPGRFHRAFPFPSLNVQDLHTVDNGILANLYMQLHKKDWSVTIAHFLGVDHCGHRYGPNHPAMEDKLNQMNKVITNITSIMGDDTVLFVMGDHGMTRTGDHGGDSHDELETGLFVYSPTQILASTQPSLDNFSTIAQTDFVPTFSLLMGLPIPFSNLGHVITDLFSYCPWWQTTDQLKQTVHAVKTLRLNAIQMSRYLQAYQQLSSDFPITEYYKLENLLSHAENDLRYSVMKMATDGDTKDILGRVQEAQKRYDYYISRVREICQSIWAKFDLISMSIGVMSLILTLLINVYFIQISVLQKDVSSSVIVVILFCLVYIVYAVFQAFFVGETISSFMVFLLGSFNIIAVIIMIISLWPHEPKLISDLQIKDKKEAKPSKILAVFVSGVCVLQIISFFSNSFVVYEDAVCLFLAQSITWLYCFKTIFNNFKKWDFSQSETKIKRHKIQQKSYDIMLVFTHPVMITVFITLLLNLCLRLSMNFKACREEQQNCDISLFLLPLSTLTDELENYKNVRYFFSVGCLMTTVYFTRRLIQHFGNMNGNSPAVLCMRYVLFICSCLCALHWALTGLPQKLLDSLPVWQQVFLPRTIYILIIISMLVITAKPLCIYLIDQTSSLSRNANMIPQVYNQMKKDMDPQGSNRPPLVYGLATSFSSSVICLGAMVTILLILVLGDGLSPSILLMTLCVYLALEIYTAERISSQKNDLGLLQHDLWTAVVYYSTLSSLFFYTSGHQTAVTTIRWEAAYIGFHGDFNRYMYFIPAALIHLNTFAARYFFAVISPLIIFWPLVKGTVAKVMVESRNGSEKSSKGDFILFENEMLLKRRLFQLFTSLIFYHGIKVLGSVCAAAVHRRHLMVWKIFAPRFVFESVTCFTMFGLCLTMFLFVMRVNKSLNSWAKCLERS